MDNLIYVLPEQISNMLYSVDKEILKKIGQIRLRIGKPITVFVDWQEYMLCEHGLCKNDGYIFSDDDAQRLLRRLNEHSPYIHNQSICNGFVTVKGGHRIGIGGEVIYKNGKINYISHQSFFCIRCAHQIKGCFERLHSDLFPHKVESSLFFSLPGGGKTTMLRDCCRVLSNEGYNVVLVDERNEISGCYEGLPTLDVGARCDVLSSCPRKEGIISAIRGLSPDVIITDEIGNEGDLDAVNEAIACGIIVIASAHADSIKGLCSRFTKNRLNFDKYVRLSRGNNSYIEIYDENMQRKQNGGRKLCCI